MASSTDVYLVLWCSVFEWLPWPLFAYQQFSELDYYSD